MRAAGINFRDVLTVLGMYPGDPGPLGYEGAGVVAEVGAEVQGVSPGDAVMGLLTRAFGPSVVVDRRLVVRKPKDLTFAQASALPLAYATAYYALRDLAGLEAGERVLIHAGAGGVGMAAVALARHLGAEVFATASPGKWETLRRLGLDEAHIASSRDVSFEQSLAQRALGIGTVTVVGTDATAPTVVLHDVEEPEQVKELIRQAVRDQRRRHRVRQVEGDELV